MKESGGFFETLGRILGIVLMVIVGVFVGLAIIVLRLAEKSK